MGTFKKGQFVVQGKFFLRENIIDQTYKLDEKVAAVLPELYIIMWCLDIKGKR